MSPTRDSRPCRPTTPMAVAAVFTVLIAFGLCSQIAVHAHKPSGAAIHPHHLVRKDDRSKTRQQDGSADSLTGPRHKIPRILHYIFLDGFDAFNEASKRPESLVKKENFEFCQSAHRQWESMFWDRTTALQLLKEHYSWFVPIWEGYDMEAKRSDALRVFLMHHYGGMYLDLDVECFRAADESFKEYDLVFQGTGDEGINNAVMASVPGHPFWQTYAKFLVERSKMGPAVAPMLMSGTIALTKSLMQYIVSPKKPVSGFLGGEFQVAGSDIKIYPIGEWFVPCYGVDLICSKQFERERQTGEWDMTNLYGRHQFAESTQPKLIEEGLKPHTVN